MDEKNKNIQILRGLAIAAVVMIHNLPSAVISEQVTPSGLTQIFCRPFLNFCVGLFLFLSAMLSSAEEWKPLKRIKKIIIPYILWTIIYVLMRDYSHPSRLPIILIKELFAGTAAVQLYYVFVYCELTLLIPFVDRLARSKYKYLGFIVAPLEIILMRFLPLILGIELNHYVILIRNLSCLAWFTYFYLGYLLGNGLISIKANTKRLIILLLISIVLQIAEGYWYYRLGEVDCGAQQKLSSVLTGAIFSLLAFRFSYSKTSENLPVLKILGDNSSGIYFSHMAIKALLEKLPFYGNLFSLLKTVIILFVNVICIYFVKRVLGKNSKYLAF